MTDSARSWVRATVLGVVLLLGPALSAPAEETAGAAGAASPETDTTMDRIFESIRFVLPLSLDDSRFQDPERRAEILAALETLADSGARLEALGHGKDASFGFLSRSLARDTREIQQRYADGRYSEARFLLHQLTEDCVACHSRLPDQDRSSLGEQFVSREQIQALPLDERARIEMATRQLERALETHEALLRSPDFSPNTLDLHGHIDDYLELCLRVHRDHTRPIPVFEAMLKRDDLSTSLRANLTSWIAALRRLDAEPPEGTPLERARKLVGIAESRSQYPNDRRALVEYVEASSILLRYVDSVGEPHPGVGEAYYLLGVIESRIGRSFWLSQTEHFLETAIRLDPSQPYAEEAFSLLEEFVVAGYTGSSGVHVPEEVRQRLAELRALIDAS
jgi:hypothetical protein